MIRWPHVKLFSTILLHLSFSGNIRNSKNTFKFELLAFPYFYLFVYSFSVLGRNISLSDDDMLVHEQFLQESLYVPRSWIAEAKAICACSAGNHGDEAWYLIQVYTNYYHLQYEKIFKWLK